MKAPVKGRGPLSRLSKLIAPVLQPRFAMGMAMTILSFSILSRFVPMQQLKAADLRPSEVWASLPICISGKYITVQYSPNALPWDGRQRDHSAGDAKLAPFYQRKLGFHAGTVFARRSSARR